MFVVFTTIFRCIWKWLVPIIWKVSKVSAQYNSVWKLYDYELVIFFDMYEKYDIVILSDNLKIILDQKIQYPKTIWNLFCTVSSAKCWLFQTIVIKFFRVSKNNMKFIIHSLLHPYQANLLSQHDSNFDSENNGKLDDCQVEVLRPVTSSQSVFQSQRATFCDI